MEKRRQREAPYHEPSKWMEGSRPPETPLAITTASGLYNHTTTGALAGSSSSGKMPAASPCCVIDLENTIMAGINFVRRTRECLDN
jgi:hypothetical protein